MNYNHAFADNFKNMFDFNQFFSTQRRNFEVVSAANQVCAEGLQAMSRCGAEAMRSGVENVLKASKEIMTGGSPETSMAKQAELARSIFESTLTNLREITETATKSGFEAFDMINRRTAESLDEITRASGNAAAAATKKKNA